MTTWIRGPSGSRKKAVVVAHGIACSAPGDAAPEHDDAPQPLPTPLLVERPVLWLLERREIIEAG